MSKFNQWWQNRRPQISAESYHCLCSLLRSSGRTVVLTGAGISTGSGIPDFRSPDSGLWQQTDALAVASLSGFRSKPERFYEWIRPLARKLMQAKPNPAHRALAALEAAGLVDTVITQNIDDLHQQAGSRNVIQIHGRAGAAVCLACQYREEDKGFWERLFAASVVTVPACPRCGEVLKPDVVLFGEELPKDELARAQQAALNCDLMLVAGTSLEVMPAGDLPLLARRRGAQLAILNLGATNADHCAAVLIREDVTVSLPQVAQQCLAE